MKQQEAKTFELIQRLQQIIKVHKVEKPTIQKHIGYKEVHKGFQDTTCNF
jgi:hypothetical protein